MELFTHRKPFEDETRVPILWETFIRRLKRTQRSLLFDTITSFRAASIFFLTERIRQLVVRLSRQPITPSGGRCITKKQPGLVFLRRNSQEHKIYPYPCHNPPHTTRNGPGTLLCQKGAGLPYFPSTLWRGFRFLFTLLYGTRWHWLVHRILLTLFLIIFSLKKSLGYKLRTLTYYSSKMV